MLTREQFGVVAMVDDAVSTEAHILGLAPIRREGAPNYDPTLGGIAVGTAKERRDEALRLKDIIGWSWAKLGERFGLTPGQTVALQKCTRPIPDSDLEWLGLIAAAVSAIPRPPVTEPVYTQRATKMESGQFVPADAAAESRGRARARMEAARAIADQYQSEDLAAMTPDQAEGAKHVLAALAMSMGLLEEVRALIGPTPAPSAPSPAFENPAVWDPPVPARDVGERTRMPFG